MSLAADFGVGEKPAVRKVLLVDDHDILLKYLARDFVRQEVVPFTAHTRDEAMAIMTAEQPELAVVDLFLAPPENGIQLVKELKATSPSLFCIVMSAHMSVAHAVLAMQAGADDVFVKPVAAKQALDRITGGPRVPDFTTPTLHQVEWEHIARALHDYDGNITHAAEALGVLRQSLQRKIRKHAPRALETGTKKKRRRKNASR